MYVLYNCYTCNVTLYIVCAQSTPSLLKELYHQWRVQEFVRGGDENLKGFFFFVLFNFSTEGPAQKIPDKIIFPGACPGIRKRGGGGAKSERLFFFFFFFSIF